MNYQETEKIFTKITLFRFKSLDVFVNQVYFVRCKGYDGGGILVNPPTKTLTVLESTFLECSADNGAAIYSNYLDTNNISKTCFNNCSTLRLGTLSIRYSILKQDDCVFYACTSNKLHAISIFNDNFTLNRCNISNENGNKFNLKYEDLTLVNDLFSHLTTQSPTFYLERDGDYFRIGIDTQSSIGNTIYKSNIQAMNSLSNYINVFSTSSMANGYTLALNDSKEAIYLAKDFREYDRFYYKNDEYFMYNPLARQYWSLLEGQTRLKNRYRQLIEIVFPEFALIFNDLYDDLTLNFIHDFPHPSLFVNRRSDYLMNYLKDKNGTTKAYRFKNKVLKMKQLASNSLCSESFNFINVQNLVQITEMIQYHKSEINKIKSQLINGMKDKKLFKIINSIPGFGSFSTALFLAEVGDITRFDNKYQFISFIGIDSVTSQSGISSYHGPISKTGCKFGRTILFNVITTLLQISARTDKTNPIYLFFRKKQSEGKHHYKCIIACETKLCKIIYKLCSSNCLYTNK